MILLLIGFSFGQRIASEEYVPFTIAVEEKTDDHANYRGEDTGVALSPQPVCIPQEEKRGTVFTTAKSNPAFPLTGATDNNKSTTWYGSASESFPKLLTMDLKETYCIHSFSLIVPLSDTPLIVSLEISSDGVTWEEIVHEERITQERFLDKPLPLYEEGRYLRLIQHSSSRPFGAVTEWSVHVGKPISGQ
jgi:hypothetical protein